MTMTMTIQFEAFSASFQMAVTYKSIPTCVHVHVKFYFHLIYTICNDNTLYNARKLTIRYKSVPLRCSISLRDLCIFSY